MKPILYKLRMPEEISALIRGMRPELKKKSEAGLKTILEVPHTGKMLRDESSGLHLMRVSKLRMIYRISKKEIQIVAICPRTRIYDETYRLLRREK